MADFTLADVDRIARLARLALSDEERTLFVRQLSDILAYAQQVSGLDTSGVPPTAHALADQIPLREDVVRPSLDRDDVLVQAPDAAAGLFKVPRVLGS